MKIQKISPADLVEDDIHYRGDVIPVDDEFVQSIAKSGGPRSHIECWADTRGKLHILDGYRRQKAVKEAMERGLLAKNFKMTVLVDPEVKNKKEAAKKAFLIAVSRKEHNRMATAVQIYSNMYNNKDQKIATAKEVADELGISKGKVESSVMVVKHAPKKVRAALELEKITLEQARRLCNLAADKWEAALSEMLRKNNPAEMEAALAAIENRVAPHKRATFKKMSDARKQAYKEADGMALVEGGAQLRAMYLVAVHALDLCMGTAEDWESLIDPMRIPGVKDCLGGE